MNPASLRRFLKKLDAAYPDATTALAWSSPFELLVATILAAQAEDAKVNQVTPTLFARFGDPASLATAPLDELEAIVAPLGLKTQKARWIRDAAAGLVAHHDGEVPRSMDALTALSGVGRKTANTVLGTAFGIASGIATDTHLRRTAVRIGLAEEGDAAEVEAALMKGVPRERWTAFAHAMTLHGRHVCTAKAPRCASCTVEGFCRKVGVTS